MMATMKNTIRPCDRCPANVFAALTALDLSNRVFTGSLFVEECFDAKSGKNAWMVLDTVFNLIAVMRNGVAVITANKRRA